MFNFFDVILSFISNSQWLNAFFYEIFLFFGTYLELFVVYPINFSGVSPGFLRGVPVPSLCIMVFPVVLWPKTIFQIYCFSTNNRYFCAEFTGPTGAC